MLLEDTIAAVSSAAGAAARMIVRASGAMALDLLAGIERPPGAMGEIPSSVSPARQATDSRGPAARRSALHFAELVVPAWVYVYPSPRSYTGQDLVEFHIPGNPLLARMLLDEL